MNQKMRLLFIAAFIALVLPLAFAVVNSEAVFYTPSDGATKTNATGQWVLDDPGYCTDGAGDTVSKATATAGTSATCEAYVAADSATCLAGLVDKCTDGVSADATACSAAGYVMKKSRSWTTHDGGATTACYATFTNERLYGASTTTDPYINHSGYEGCLHCHNDNYMDVRKWSGGALKTEENFHADGTYFRAMEGYLNTAHKNGLRKVYPGSRYGGPLYTGGDAAGNAYVNLDPADNTLILMGCSDPTFTTIQTCTGAVPAGEWSYDYGVDTGNVVKYLYRSFLLNTKEEQMFREELTDPLSSSTMTASANSTSGCFYCHTGGLNLATVSGDTVSGPIYPDEASGDPMYTTGNKWAWNGIQCSTCHGYLNSPVGEAHHGGWGEFNGSHLVKPVGEGPAITAMCMICHRSEETVAYNVAPDPLLILDGEYEHGNYGGQFLNSPHGKFSGTYGQIADNSLYASHFVDHSSTAVPQPNLGCTGCHEVHYSGVDPDVLDPTSAVTDMKASCGTSCHPYLQPAGAPTYGMPTIAHPAGPGTPLDGDLSTAKGIQMACMTCHMSTEGLFHLFRISADATYTTPATADAVADGEISIDLDLACGQCHGGSAGVGGTMLGAPFLSKEALAPYAQIMHGGVPEDNGLTAVEPVLPPTAGSCDSTLTADGTMSALTGTTATVFTLTDTTTQASDLYIYWGDGTGITQTTTHTYSNVGTYQVIQTVKNPCGYKSQKIYTITVTGGTTGKGTMTLSATPTTTGGAGSTVSYSVLSSGVSITNGTLTVGGASKVITLDGGNYSVKIGYSTVTPLTDPVTYKSCDLMSYAGTVAIGKCVHEVTGQPLSAFADATSCTTALHVWQVTGQQAPVIPVTGGADTAVALTCN